MLNNIINDDEYPTVNQYLFLIFLLYIPVWYLQVGKRIEILGKVRIEFILGFFLVIVSFLIIFKNKNYLIDLSRNLIIISIIFYLLLFLYVPFSFYPNFSFDVWFNRVFKFSFFALFIFTFVNSPKQLRLFIFILMLSWLKLGEEGFIGKLTGGLIWQNQGIMRLHGPTLLYKHPNSFSGLAVGMLPFIYFYLPVVNKKLKLLLIIQLIFAVNIIVFTGSRTGYVGVLVFFLVIFLKTRKKISNLFIGILILFIFGLTMPSSYFNRFESIFTGNLQVEGIKDSSRLKRIEILQDAIKIYTKYPFGTGIGTFPLIREKIFGRIQDTHNLYLQILTNIGIFGFIFFIFLIIMMLRNIKRIIYNLNNQLYMIETFTNENLEEINDIKFIKATAESLYLFIIIRLVLGIFGHDLYEIYWWFSLGLTLALNTITYYHTLKSKRIRNNEILNEI